MKKRNLKAKLLFLVGSLFILNCAAVFASGGNWTSAGSDLRNSRSAGASSGITTGNVGGLLTKWIFDARGEISATPTVEGNAVYLTDWGNPATDGKRIYVALSNQGNKPFTMKGGESHNSGAFAALNPATGEIIWQVKAPVSNSGMDWGMGPLAVANGVVFGASFSGQMTALDAATGATLWNYANPADAQTPGSNICGASVAGGTVYWGTGYSNLGFGNPDHRLFAFTPAN